MTTIPPKLLFICTHNACRSILAEAICRQLVGDQYIVASAGSNPAGKIFPETLSKLTEHGYSVDGLHSKSWDDLSEYHADIVITVCDQAAGESCPVWFDQAIKVHWGLTDASKITDSAERSRGFDELIARLETHFHLLMQLQLVGLSPTELNAKLNHIGTNN